MVVPPRPCGLPRNSHIRWTRFRGSGHDDNGKLLSIKDRNGQGVTLSYGGDAIVDTATDSVGRVITFTHDPTTGRLTNVALPDGRDISYGYTGDLLTSVTDVRDNATTYTYHANSEWLQKIIDQNNNTVVTNTFSTSGASAGRVISQLDARNNLTSSPGTRRRRPPP